MCDLTLTTSVCVLSSLQAQVFLNQLYKTPVELVLKKNPDLRAIRFASFNPILDPWIYILLRKAVLLKVIEKIKCLFCKVGSRGQQRPGNFHCMDAHQLSSAISKRESLSLVSHNLRDINSSSQAFFYLPEGCDLYCGSCQRADGPSSVANAQASRGPGEDGEEARVAGDISALPRSKEPPLQVSLGTETAEEKRI